MLGKKIDKKKNVEEERSGVVASVVWSEGVINGTMESEIETPEKYLLDEGAVCLAAAPFGPMGTSGVCHRRWCFGGQIFFAQNKTKNELTNKLSNGSLIKENLPEMSEKVRNAFTG